MASIISYLRIIRPINCFMVGIAVIIGVILTGFSPSVSDLTVLVGTIYGFITGFALSASSMVINDYFDREIDAINEPHRPIPSGEISPKKALVFGIILMTVGLAVSYLVNIYCFFLTIASGVIFILYTIGGKQTGLIGNFLVSTCIGMPFLFGNFVVSDKIQLNIILLMLLAFLSNTGREICKGIIDVRGDRMKNVRTLAVRYGERNAAMVASVFFLFSVFLSPIPWIFHPVSFWFFPFMLMTELGLVLSSLILIKNPSRENARKVKSLVLISFMFGLLAFAFGGYG